MEYLKLQKAFRNTKAWQRATTGDRGTWVSVVGHCADVENCGRIEGAVTWDDRMWLQCAGVTREEIGRATEAGLFDIAGDDLLVAGYDHIGERTYQERREQGRNGGRASGEARRRATDRHTKALERKVTARQATTKRTLQAHASTEHEPHAQASGKRALEPISIPITTTRDSSTPPPGDSARASPEPGGGGGARKRISALDPTAIVLATRSQDLGAVLRAFGANAEPARLPEWRREVHDLTPSQVGVILFDAYADREPVREPSGFRARRRAWEALGGHSRQAMADALKDFAQPFLAAERGPALAAEG